MAEESAKLRIPYLAAAQAQKHVTHNEAMTLLDTLVQLSVLDKDLTAPPASPSEGDTYIVAAGATGGWIGWDGRIARYIDGTWRSYLPGEGGGAGWLAYVIDESTLYVFNGTAWELFAAGGSGSGDVTTTGAATALHLVRYADASGDVIEDAGVAASALQPLHANLTAVAGLSLVADRLPYANGTGTLALATFTSAGRALIDDTDAAAQRATLGLGTVATQNTGTSGTNVPLLDGNNVFSGTAAFTNAPFTVGSATDLSTALVNESNTAFGAGGVGFQVAGVIGNVAQARFANNGVSGRYLFAKSRGATVADYTVVQSGDALGLFLFEGADGSNFCAGASFGAYVDGTPGSDDMPGRLVFATSADGAAAPSESFRLAQAGNAYFPRISTTASAANAFLNSGSSPANELLRSTSSLRYKKDVEPVDPDRSKAVLDLQPIWYRSTADADNPQWSWYGLAAEDVAALDPRLVHWGYAMDDWEEVFVGEGEERRLERKLKDGAQLRPESVMYDRITVLLLDEVKRLSLRVSLVEGSKGDDTGATA
jgi:Protein of unknown function (DUF2793)